MWMWLVLLYIGYQDLSLDVNSIFPESLPVMEYINKHWCIPRIWEDSLFEDPLADDNDDDDGEVPLWMKPESFPDSSLCQFDILVGSIIV